MLLRGLPDGSYHPLALDGWPRVADVDAADFNGDGDTRSGGRRIWLAQGGNVSMLENHTVDYSHPSFETAADRPPVRRHPCRARGPRQGREDGPRRRLRAAVRAGGRVHEQRRRGASFTPQVIYTGPHPNWGSSGIQVVDLDGDGDLDVLLTHGDTFDDAILKPYHGIQWLENRGTFPFVEHTLAELPGVSRAQAADLDGDGDLDIVACAFIAAGSDRDEVSCRRWSGSSR